jgi:malonate-semialdehyde dehydrogenase (acetylating)/methylmalonate-semialdehyde dehydrogenase
VTNPATGDVIAQVPYATAAQVDRVARTAHAAFLKWREVPVIDRVQIFYKYKALLDKHADEVARILSTENGKTLDDARMSVKRAIQMVEVACGMPSLMMGDSLENVSKGIDCHTIGNRWACARASRPSISRRWCRCGCSRSPSRAAIASS